MPLTDIAARNAKPDKKTVRLSHERNFYLEIPPVRRRRSAFPDMSLSDARERREVARKLLANGVDPSETRKAEKAAPAESAANSFEVLSREWFAKYSPS